ncbi:unnamed protein product [Medioppia subpectinata]|uniref:BTB domain-containing protein n=1 Tax=Medioppia subpectinata TaxID=1979941 RepID=A0A7R9KV19_9ACAR|nr:unnamed protein product [Medioppia subpectinata]CAG2110227.1 unnamed protein product [Medioppia subpectinata]
MAKQMTIHSMDQLPIVSAFKILRPVMNDRRLKTSVRLLCVFGYNGSEVLFATTDDKVYAFGDNKFGRLGVGADTSPVTDPTLVTALCGQRLANVYYGFGHCIGVTSDGRCYGWGDNSYGQLGDGRTRCHSNAPQLIPIAGPVVDVSCGNSFTIVLTRVGHMYGFGRNLMGQLGDGSLISRLTPTPLDIDFGGRVLWLASGRNHTAVVTDTGRAYVWGLNICGQLGHHMDGDLIPGQQMPACATPEPVKRFRHRVSKAVCGPDHTLLLTTDGQVYAFGENKHRQIGNGSTDTQWTPFCVADGIRFKDIYAKSVQALCIAVSVDDRYYVWGGSKLRKPQPQPEPMATHTVYDIYAVYTTLEMTFEAIIIDNKTFREPIGQNVVKDLICFENKVIDGINGVDYGGGGDCQYSLNSNGFSSGSDVMAISEELIPMHLFARHLSDMFDNECDYDFLFVFNDKRIYCHKSVIKIRNKQFWQKCQQMLNKINNNSIDNEIHIKSYSYDSFYPFLQFLYAIKPKITPRIAREVLKLATLYSESVLHECCGQTLGSSDETIDLSNICSLYEKSITNGCVDLNIYVKFPDLCPQTVVTEDHHKLKIKVLAVFGDNGDEVIVVTADDRVYGFGTNRFGRLGLGVNGLIARPQLNATLTGKKITKICYGLGHCIGLTRSGQCYGWGHNASGQLGIRSVEDMSTPQPIKILNKTLLPKPVTDISCGDNHSLVLTKDGFIYSFGANDRRQCGHKEGEMIWRPFRVKIKDRFVSISCGRSHSSALTDTGIAYVWGSNDSQQLGPKAVVVPGKTYCWPQLFKIGHNSDPIYETVICGPNHTVLLAAAGVVYLYGSYDWKPDPKSDPLLTIFPNKYVKAIDTTYDNRVVIVTAIDGQLFILGKADGSITWTLIDIPIGCSLFDIYAKYCGYNRTFASIVDLIQTSMSSMKSCSQSDEEIYWSEEEETEERNDLVINTIGPHIDDKCQKSGSVLPDGTSDVLISESIDPKSSGNSTKSSLCLNECEDNMKNTVTVDSKNTASCELNLVKSSVTSGSFGRKIATKSASIAPRLSIQSIEAIKKHLLPNKASTKSCSKTVEIYSSEEGNQCHKLRPNNCSESDEEIYLSDSECEESHTTGTIDSKSTDSCDPIVSNGYEKHSFKAFNNRLDYDLRFIVENQFIYCHKSVLKIRNKEFWEICEQNMFTEREIEINAYSYDTIKAFLMFLYGLRPEVNDQNCTELLGLAEDYGEHRLQDICRNSRNVNKI